METIEDNKGNFQITTYDNNKKIHSHDGKPAIVIRYKNQLELLWYQHGEFEGRYLCDW